MYYSQYSLNVPTEMRTILSLEVFQTQLDKVLNSLVWPHSQHWFHQEAGLQTAQGPFQSDLFWFMNEISLGSLSW